VCCMEVFAATGNMPLAVQIEGHLTVAPLDYCMQQDDVMFVVAMAGASLKASAKTRPNGEAVDYRDHFARNQIVMTNDALRDDLLKFVLEEDASLKMPTAVRQSSNQKSNFQDAAKSQMILPQFSAVSPNSAHRVHSKELDGSNGARTQRAKKINNFIEAEFGHGAKQKRNTDELFRKEEEAREAASFIEQGGHILLLVAQADLLWQQILAFVRPLRADYLPNFQPIVVLCPKFPPKSLWDTFDDVAFIEGFPSRREDLEKAGATSASRVVLLSGPPIEGQERNLDDSEATVVSSTLELMLKEQDLPLNLGIYEYNDPHNIHLTSRMPEMCYAADFKDDQSPAEKDYMSDDHAAIIGTPFLTARYASGRLCAPSVLGSLFGQAYSTLGMLELAEAMLMPSRRGQSCYPWMLPVPLSFVGATYQDLVSSCLEEGLGIGAAGSRVLPVGMYRNIGDVEEQIVVETELCFVLTNPPPDTTILANDRLYVFASKEWGHALHAQEPEPFQQPPPCIVDVLGPAQDPTENPIWSSMQEMRLMPRICK